VFSSLIVNLKEIWASISLDECPSVIVGNRLYSRMLVYRKVDVNVDVYEVRSEK
jgi:hypothetical protein